MYQRDVEEAQAAGCPGTAHSVAVSIEVFGSYDLRVRYAISSELELRVVRELRSSSCGPDSVDSPPSL